MKRICILVLFALCTCVATAADKLWISSFFGGQLGIVDLGTNTLLGAIAVVSPPQAVLFDPARGVVYVGQFATNNIHAPGAISVVRAATNTLIDEIPMPNSRCIPLAINAAGNRLYVRGMDQVLVIDPYTYAVIADIPILIANTLTLNADGTRLYVVKVHSTGGPDGTKGDDRLLVYDTATYTEIASIPIRPDEVDAPGYSVVLSPDGSYAYVPYDIGNDLSITHFKYMAKIDTKTNKVVAQIPLPDNGDYIPAGFNQSGTKLYLFGRAGLDPEMPAQGYVSVFDMNLSTVTTNIPVPAAGVIHGASQMTLSRAGDFAYVANAYTDVGTPNSASLSLVDLNTNIVLTNIPLPNNTFSGIAVGTPPSCGIGNVLARPDGVYSVDSEHGVVTDNTTGLMWKRCSEGQNGGTCSGTATTMFWSEALTAAATSSFAGYSDWRVPNVKELETLVETACFTPAINHAVFPSTVSAQYWSSTTVTETLYKAWAVYFDGNGSMNYPTRKAFDPSYVRLVRGGRAGASFDRVSPPGDANGDHAVTVSDVLYLINSLFAGGPGPVGLADVNGDRAVTVADALYLINYLFAGGPPPIF